jgi:hypothetical protein
MNLTPEQFLQSLQEGKTEKELNQKENSKTIEELKAAGIKKNPATLKYLVKYQGHTEESAAEHLNTDYSNGYTICNKCGSFYYLGKGFTKHLSNGCLHCEGQEKHHIYFNSASDRISKKMGFKPRYMSVMFDDGMSYCKDKLEIEKYKNLLK